MQTAIKFFVCLLALQTPLLIAMELRAGRKLIPYSEESPKAPPTTPIGPHFTEWQDNLPPLFETTQCNESEKSNTQSASYCSILCDMIDFKPLIHSLDQNVKNHTVKTEPPLEKNKRKKADVCYEELPDSETELEPEKKARIRSPDLIACQVCNQQFKYKHHYLDHKKIKHPEPGTAPRLFFCTQEFCKKNFLRQGDLTRHEKKPHPIFQCFLCDQFFALWSVYRAHRKNCRRISPSKEQRLVPHE